MKTKIFALLFYFIVFLQTACTQTNLLVNRDFERSPSDGSIVANGWRPEQTNLLVNGDFERSPSDGSIVANGWRPEWYPNTAGAITTATAAKKGKGLWMYTGSGSSLVWIYQTVNCLSNTNYRASAFLRCPSAQMGTWTNRTEAYLTIEFQNSTGVSISDPQISGRMSLSNAEWQEYSLHVRTPENAARIIFTIKLTSVNGRSILNVDDCFLVQI